VDPSPTTARGYPDRLPAGPFAVSLPPALQILVACLEFQLILKSASADLPVGGGQATSATHGGVQRGLG
jgi:hypothetical protein